MEEITYFGLTSFRNQLKKFGIKKDDRRRHMYIIGKTGMGKTGLLENLAVQDIVQGHGLAFIDPHGEAAEKLLEFIPAQRMKDVVYFNPSDTNFPFSFNVMENVDEDKRHLIATGLMGVFKKIWPDVWSARMEYILNNCVLALLEYPDATILGINWMLSDADFRAKVVEHVKDPVIKNFWTKEFARYNQRYEVEASAAIQNKIGQFISNPLIRNIIGQPHSTIDMRDVMDSKKILILNLSKGRIGEENSRLLGALLVTKLYLAAMSRVDMPEHQRQDFYLYVDEFQNFATEAFVNILSEARKYRLCLTLAHQYIAQLDETVRDGVFGNVGTLIVFRVGAEDAEWLEKEFTPVFVAEDLVNLTKYNIYVKLMIDGIASQPFSALTMVPPVKPEHNVIKEIIEFSRKTYATPRKIVDQAISDFSNEMGGEAVVGESYKAKETALFDATCTNCGKNFKAPFKPEPGRAIYCKNCFKKVIEARNENKEAPAPAKEEKKPERKFIKLSEMEEKEVLPFFAPKPKKDTDKPKKEVDLSELKGIIGSAIEERISGSKEKFGQEKKQEDNSNRIKKGSMRPGEKIEF